MATHAGSRDDVKDDSGYQPKHALPKFGKYDWDNYNANDSQTQVIPVVKDGKKK